MNTAHNNQAFVVPSFLSKKHWTGCDERPVEQPVPPQAGESSVVKPDLKNDFYVLYRDIVRCTFSKTLNPTEFMQPRC